MGRGTVDRDPPKTVKDRDSWALLHELDEHGAGLSQWEIDFVESLAQQLLLDRFLSAEQRARLDSLREERLP